MKKHYINALLEVLPTTHKNDKRQSKTLFLTILDLRLLIVLTFSIARLSQIFIEYRSTEYVAKPIRNKGY